MAAVSGNNNLSLMGMPPEIPTKVAEFSNGYTLNCLRVTSKQFKEIAEYIRRIWTEEQRLRFPDRFVKIQRADTRFAGYTASQRENLGADRNHALGDPVDAGQPIDVAYAVERDGEGLLFLVYGYEKTLLVRDLKYGLLQRGDTRLSNEDGSLNNNICLQDDKRRVMSDDVLVSNAFPSFCRQRMIRLGGKSLGHDLYPHEYGAERLKEFNAEDDGKEPTPLNSSQVPQ